MFALSVSVVNVTSWLLTVIEYSLFQASRAIELGMVTLLNPVVSFSPVALKLISFVASFIVRFDIVELVMNSNVMGVPCQVESMNSTGAANG